MKTSLNPDARVVVIEYDRRGFFSFHRLFGHFVPKERIVKEIAFLHQFVDDVLGRRTA